MQEEQDPKPEADKERDRLLQWLEASTPAGPYRRRVGLWTWNVGYGCCGCDDCVKPVRLSPWSWALWLLHALRRPLNWAESWIEARGLRAIHRVTGGRSVGSGLTGAQMRRIVSLSAQYTPAQPSGGRRRTFWRWALIAQVAALFAVGLLAEFYPTAERAQTVVALACLLGATLAIRDAEQGRAK